MFGMTYAKAIENVDAVKKLLGRETIYLSEFDGNTVEQLPWEFVTSVEEGNSHSYIGPRSVNFVAKHPSGLKFHWSLDLSPSRNGNIEKRPFFDHSAIVDMTERLPSAVRPQLTALFRDNVLPPLRKQIEEARLHLHALLEGEAVLTGVVSKATA